LFRRTLAVDAVVDFTHLDGEALRSHDQLEPFGASNRQPVFVSRGARISEWREFSPGCFNVALEQAGELSTATVWRSQSELQALVREERRFDVAFTIAPDSYGRRGIGLQILDFSTEGSGAFRNEKASLPV
jgi:single-stranded DNA-specific DHH superfamily exonuclease